MARRSISVAAGSDMYLILGELHLNLARILAKGGQADDGPSSDSGGAPFFNRKEVVPAIARTEAFLAELGAA